MPNFISQMIGKLPCLNHLAAKILPPTFQVVDTIEPDIFRKTYGVMGADGKRRSLAHHTKKRDALKNLKTEVAIPAKQDATQLLSNAGLLAKKEAKLQTTLKRREQFFDYLANAPHDANSFKALGQWHLRQTSHDYPRYYGKEEQVAKPRTVPIIQLNYLYKHEIKNELLNRTWRDESNRLENRQSEGLYLVKYNKMTELEKKERTQWIRKTTRYDEQPAFILTGAHGIGGFKNPLSIGTKRSIKTTLKKFFKKNEDKLNKFYGLEGAHNVCSSLYVTNNHYDSHQKIILHDNGEIWIKSPRKIRIMADNQPSLDWQSDGAGIYTTTSYFAEKAYLEKIWNEWPSLREINNNKEASGPLNWFRMIS
jgi:hypothetical protein